MAGAGLGAEGVVGEFNRSPPYKGGAEGWEEETGVPLTPGGNTAVGLPEPGPAAKLECTKAKERKCGAREGTTAAHKEK